MSAVTPMRRPLAIAKVFVVVVFIALLAAPKLFAAAQKEGTEQTGAPKSRVRAVGTIKAITGDTIAVTTDTGAEVNVILQPSTRMVRSIPGQTDLKSASPIQVQDLQVGDRLLASGTASEDGKSVLAATAIVMKKSDIAEKQEQDREEWQKHGVGGVVKAVDAETGTIKIPTGTLPAKDLTIHVAKTPSFAATRRIRSSSMTPSRARSTRSSSGTNFARAEPAAP